MKGYVRKRGDTWYLAVHDGEKVVVTDNTNCWRSMFDTCYYHVGAFRRIAAIGHRIEKSYGQLMQEVME